MDKFYDRILKWSTMSGGKNVVSLAKVIVHHSHQQHHQVVANGVVV